MHTSLRFVASLSLPLLLAGASCTRATDSSASSKTVAPAAPAAPAAKDTVTTAEIKAVIGTPKAPFLLDVRSPEEFSDGHVPGATNVPVSEVGTRVDEIRKKAGDRPIVVYCLSGARTARARQTLAAAGVTTSHMVGDWEEWDAANLPAEKGASK